MAEQPIEVKARELCDDATQWVEHPNAYSGVKKNEPGRIMATTPLFHVDPDDFGVHGVCDDEDDAAMLAEEVCRRAVACCRACSSIPTDQLASVARLVEAVQAAFPDGGAIITDETLARIQAALAPFVGGGK